MATDAELRDQAVAELKQTTVGYQNKHWTVPPDGSHWDKALDALGLIGQVMPPPDPPPSSGGLRWPAPGLMNPVTKTLTNASRHISSGVGGDLIVKFGEVLAGDVGEYSGYNDAVWIAGEFKGGTTGSQGHIIPRENTGTQHFEGLKLVLTTNADAFTPRWRSPIVQIQRTYVEVTKAATDMHSDGFQTQHSILNELRIDHCTFRSDYQAVFLSNEPALATAPARSKVGKTFISNTQFLRGVRGYPKTYFFKAWPPRPGADPIGPVELINCWIDCDKPTDALNLVYPNGTSWGDWNGQPNTFGCFLEQRTHPKDGKSYPFARFSTTADKVPAGKALAGQTCGDCGILGDGGLWIANGLAPAIMDATHPANAGFDYKP